MDGQGDPYIETGQGVLATAFVPCDDRGAIPKLRKQLGDASFVLVVLFVSADADLPAIMAEAAAAWPDSQVMGCTTAGEIARNLGYVEGGIVALGFAEAHFRAETVLFREVSDLVEQDVIGETIRARARLSREAGHLTNEFALLLVDGLSLSEDHLASALATGLGPVPMFGGSSGDGVRFESAPVAMGTETHQNAAVLALLRTDCDMRVFSLNNFTPTEQRMVVTRADPSRRLVQEINAEPAALELGRLLGKAPQQIDTFTFAANPVVVRFGNTHHVRAIKRVTEDGALEFFSAIDEGMVLTIAEAEPMVEHLRQELGLLSSQRKPDAVIACDCILRRIEAEQKQLQRDVSAVLRDYNVAGFSTYGEQFGGLHVNQTMTGVAFFVPE